MADADAVDLYWLPLGAGGHSVRLNGVVYEALVARRERRQRSALYHAALEVLVSGTRYVIEMAPIPDAHGSRRGVVAEGPVGARWAGRLRLFRYEVRCWRDGEIQDVSASVDSPRRLTDDPGAAREVLELLPGVPRLVWGRDELGVGDMWNSNSLVSWLIARAGLGGSRAQPPVGGRAPGWRAGLVAAQGRR
jgi:hypothetical protein